MSLIVTNGGCFQLLFLGPKLLNLKSFIFFGGGRVGGAEVGCFHLSFLGPKLAKSQKSHNFGGGAGGRGRWCWYFLYANFCYARSCLFQTPIGPPYTLCKRSGDLNTKWQKLCELVLETRTGVSQNFFFYLCMNSWTLIYHSVYQ